MLYWDLCLVKTQRFYSNKIRKNMQFINKTIGKYTITRKIGEGGIIFYIDNSGKHGKVCSERDLGKSDWNSALDQCLNLNLNGYSDWYLPSQSDLKYCYEQKMVIGGFEDNIYWSSAEYYASYAHYFNFSNGDAYPTGKTNTNAVRGVRAF